MASEEACGLAAPLPSRAAAPAAPGVLRLPAVTGPPLLASACCSAGAAMQLPSAFCTLMACASFGATASFLPERASCCACNTDQIHTRTALSKSCHFDVRRNKVACQHGCTIDKATADKAASSRLVLHKIVHGSFIPAHSARRKRSPSAAHRRSQCLSA